MPDLAKMQNSEDQDLLLANLLDTGSFEFVHKTKKEHFSQCAILSHCWVGDEITMKGYKEFLKRSRGSLTALHEMVFADLDDYLAAEILSPYTEHLEHHEVQSLVKILKFCCKARECGFEFAWVDTCCINKQETTARDKAISSMWQYYAQSARCFVYMSDVSGDSAEWRSENEKVAVKAIGRFDDSKWWTRGMCENGCGINLLALNWLST